MRRAGGFAMILDRTIGKVGTVAVGEFTADGKLVAYKSNEAFSADLAMMTSQFAATTRMFLTTVAASFSHLTELPMVPYHGFIFSGGEMSSVTRQDHWAIVRTSESEFKPAKGGVELGLEELLRLPGVRLAGYYAVDGSEIACKQTIGFSPEVRATATQLVASTTTAFRGLATAFSYLSKSSWTPVKAWLYAGGDWVIAVSHCCWVLAEAGEAETDQLYRAVIR
jgi:roadblock/LC7 domain-containing protein